MTITGAQVLAFRKATKRSRGKMSEECGLTQTRISNIEKGSKEKAGDQDALEKVMRGWLDGVAADASHPDHGTVTGGDPRDPTAPVTDLAGWQAAQAAQAKTAHGPDVIMLSEAEMDDDMVAAMYDDTVPPPTATSIPVLPPVADVLAEYPQEAAPVADPNHPAPVKTGTISTRHPQPDAFPKDGIRRVSNGELRSWKRCHRKWWLAYYRRLGLMSESVLGARAIGTRVHACLASWYVPDGDVRGNPYETLNLSYEEDRAVLAGDEIKLAKLGSEVDLCRAMLEGYFQWLGETGADQGLIITAPETKLEVDAGIPGVHLIAKLDVRAIREVDGARLFIDHKTVGSLTEPLRMLHMDEQMMHYHLCEYLDLLATHQEGERTGGAMYNMLRKVKRTATANPPFYDRAEVYHNLDTLRSYWMRVKGVIDEIQAAEAKLAAGIDHREAVAPNPTTDCRWDCDFFHLCSMLDDGSRAEDFIGANLIQIDPLKRYEPKPLV